MSSDSLGDDGSVVSVSNDNQNSEKTSQYLLWSNRILFHVCSFRNFVCCILFVQALIFILLALVALLVSGYSIVDWLQHDWQVNRIHGVTKHLEDARTMHKVTADYISTGRLASMSVNDLSTIIHPILDTAFPVDAYVATKTGTDFILLRHEKTVNGTTVSTRTYTTEAYAPAAATGDATKMNIINLDPATYAPISVGSSVSTFAGRLFTDTNWFSNARFLSNRAYLLDAEFSIDGVVLNQGGIWVFSRVTQGADDWVVGALVSLSAIGSSLQSFAVPEEKIMLADLSTKSVLVNTQNVERGNRYFSDISSGSTSEGSIVNSLNNIDYATSTGEQFLSGGNTVLTRPMQGYDANVHVVSYRPRYNYGLKAMTHPAVIVPFVFSLFVPVVFGIILMLSFFVPLHVLSQKVKDVALLQSHTSGEESKNPLEPLKQKIANFKWAWYPFGEIRELANIATMAQKTTSYLKKYAPVDLIRYQIEHNEPVALGMAPAKMSILFSDLVEFTALASRLNAEKFVALLSDYFEEMIAVIERNNGHLDKLVGDAVMSLFVANRFKPCLNHEEMGVRTALQMQDRLEEMNTIWKEKGLPALKMRIGVATGESMIGNIGSQAHYSYTAISTAVNVAARLESLNTYFGTRQLIEQKTYTSVKDKYLCYWVDSVALKGRNTGTHIYELKKPRKQALGAEIEMEEHLLGLRNMLVERKFSQVISKIDSLRKNPNAPSYINKLKKRSADLVLCGEARDVDISLFLTSKN